MQKRIRPSRQIIAELGVFIDNYLSKPGASQEALAAAAGVDQSTISRVKQGADQIQLRENARLGNGVRKLCKYAGIELAEPAPESAEGREMLNTAIAEVWDGSLPHARRIARVLTALRGLRAG